MKLLSHGPEPCASANSAIPACAATDRNRNYSTFPRDCQDRWENFWRCEFIGAALYHSDILKIYRTERFYADLVLYYGKI